MRLNNYVAVHTGEENPLGTTPHTKGANEPGAKVASESYKSVIELFNQTTGSVVGTIVVYAKTRTAIIASTDLAGCFMEGAEAYENDAKATWTANISLHDPNGETYQLSLTRNMLTLSSFEAEEILAKVETWADSIPELG